MSEEVTYPIVHRLAEPLLIRPSALSLQVNDTTYYAKVKFGIKFCGFYIYVNATGYHIYDYKDEQLTTEWAGDSKQVVPTRTEESVRQKLEQEAKEWIDSLEEAILEQRSGNEIKKAIDRLTWQMHHDITGSTTDFATQFEEEGFSDITIDELNVGADPGTIPDTISGGATTIITGENGNAGLSTIASNIGDLNTDLTGSSGAIKSYIGDKLYDANNQNTVVSKLNKIAVNLKDDNDTYTISVALREENELSVSGATQAQTQLEETNFNHISNDQLGAFGSTGRRTLFDTIGNYTSSNNNTMFDAIGQTIDTAGTSTIHGQLKTANNNVGHPGNPGDPTDPDTGLYVYATKTYDNIGHPKDPTDPSDTNTGVYAYVIPTNQNLGHLETSAGAGDATGVCFFAQAAAANSADAKSYSFSIKGVTDSMTSNSTISKVNGIHEGMWGDGGSTDGFINGGPGDGTYYVKTQP